MTLDDSKRLEAVVMKVSEALDFLISGRYQQWILHDHHGPTMNVEAAYKRYAEAMGKSIEELTDDEKRAAFVDAVLDEGGA